MTFCVGLFIYIKEKNVWLYDAPSVIILFLSNIQNKYVSNKIIPLNTPSLDEPQIHKSGLWILSYTFFIL